MPDEKKRAVIYARLSKESENSISPERQVESAKRYAEARGMEIIDTFVDPNKSAVHYKPEDRPAWKKLLQSEAKFDFVIIWKVDRLARNVLDFLNADQTLAKRGARIVAVEDPVDMSTAQGRAFTTILAVFAEMEAEAIRARVVDARQKLLRDGQVPGGVVPYGWKSVPNPDGKGYVLAKDDERITYVEKMVERTFAGYPIYSTVRWLNDNGVPNPNRKRPAPWRQATVERILRHPILAGMTPDNSGNLTKVRGPNVRRDEKAGGLEIVDESIAIMTPGRWRAMLKLLDERDSPQSRPRAMKAKTSGLLSGLLFCAEDGHRMWRGTTQGREGYKCPVCQQTITNFERVVIDHFLAQKGDWTDPIREFIVDEVYEGGAARIPAIENRMEEIAAALQETDDEGEADELYSQMAWLRTERKKARAQPENVKEVLRYPDVGTYRERWAEATDDMERRAVLDDALSGIVVQRGGMGRQTPAKILSRLWFVWKLGGPQDNHVGPRPDPTSEELALDDNPYVKRSPSTK